MITAAETRMSANVRMGLLLSACVFASAANADCDVVDVATVESVLGSPITDLSGDDAETQCVFVGGSPQATLIIQLNTRDYYDQVSILEPHTPVNVGEQGRSNVDTNGVFAVQFVQGDSSATLSLRPVQQGDRDYLAGLVRIAEVVAAELD